MIQDARAYCYVLSPRDNTEHHHFGLGLLTPADVHHGLAAYATHPERVPADLPHPRW